jgi:hypothetical protein
MRTNIETLPSGGLFYGGACPDGKLTIHEITSDDEAILANQTEDRGMLIDRLIDSCRIDKSVPYDDLLLCDQVYLMFAVRNLSYGPVYNFALTCPSCRAAIQAAVNINDGITVKRLNSDDHEIEEITLHSGLEIGISRLRVRDERDIAAYAKRIGNALAVDMKNPAYTYRLAKAIRTIKGQPCLVHQAQTLFPLDSLDSLGLRTAIEDIEPGLELNLQHVCQGCGNRFVQPLTFSREFLQPRQSVYTRRPLVPKTA